MEILKDMGLVLGRIVTIFPLLLFVALFMGRRSIAEMPVFDLLILLSLGSVVGADIADPNIEHLPTAFAIVVIGIVQKVVSKLVIRYRWFGKLVTFEPIVVIHQGKLIHNNIKKARYSIDNILNLLRGQNIFDIATVHLAVIEGNGDLSVLEKPAAGAPPSISYPVIREGSFDNDILHALKLEQAWIDEQLKQQHIPLTDVFLATIDEQQRLNVTRYQELDQPQLPPVHH